MLVEHINHWFIGWLCGEAPNVCPKLFSTSSSFAFVKCKQRSETCSMSDLGATADAFVYKVEGQDAQ